MSHDDPARPPLHPETVAITHGYDPQSCLGAVKPPIFPSTTYVYRSAQHAKDVHRAYFDGAPLADGDPGLIYARLDHPNLAMVERRLAALDRAADAAVFASGMAAISATMLAFLKPGETLLHSRPLYGGTDALLNNELSAFGVRPFGFADATDEAAVRAAADEAMQHGPIGLVHLETPANPTASIADIGLVGRVCDAIRLRQGRRPILSVDNTFLGPFLQTPLEHGADLTITSLTKYAGGHSDFLAGGVSGAKEPVGRLKKLRTLLGSHLDPHVSWMLLRSLETLALRTERAGANARTVAAFLRGHPKVRRVTYLGFTDPASPAGAVLERQCAGTGSTFSFSIVGGEAEAFRMLDRLKLIRMAVSLGGTETLICHSATTTHYAVPRQRREEVGVDDATMRLSVGLEHPDDLVGDLAQALEAV
jgi:methionine-gamma-lyase